MSRPKFDVFTACVSELQQALDSGELTSLGLTSAYLDQIAQHNVAGFGLRAVIDVAPRASVQAHARQLDNERTIQGARRPLHGIPILIKDRINTDPSLGMGTTCGTLALRQAKPAKNAAIVDMSLEAGAIVIGKANLSELHNVRGSPPCPCGWSSAGDQLQSPYVRGGVDESDTYMGHSSPTGSSSGSAAGVAAGIAPISIGTETDGSTVYPASRAGLYGLKLSNGACSLAGVLPYNSAFDSAGLFAKSAQDLAYMFQLSLPTLNPSICEKPSWQGLRVGFLSHDILQLSSAEIKTDIAFTEAITSSLLSAAAKIRAAGGEVIENVHIPSVDDLAAMENGVDFDTVSFDGFRESIGAYFADLAETSVKSLSDVIAYDQANSDICLSERYNQKLIENLAAAQPDLDFPAKVEWLREHTQATINGAHESYGVDVILASGETRLCAVASEAGYACGALPLGYADTNGRAFGMHVVASHDKIDVMMRVMSAWEATFPEGRMAPPLLVNWPEQQ